MKLLRLSTASGFLENTIYGLTKHVPEIDNYYLFDKNDPGPNLDKYDLIWLTTDLRFNRVDYSELFTKLENYKGRTENFRCCEKLTQDVMTRAWINAGIMAPNFVKFPKGVPIKLSEHSIESPVMVKAAREYPRLSYATIIKTDQDLVNWDHWINYDYILQEFLPIENNTDLFFGGQSYILGKNHFPRTYRWSNQWYLSPTRRGVPHLGLKVGTFEGMPGFAECTTFDEQVKRIISVAEVDMGTLDFTLTKDGIVVPWGISTVYPYYTEGKEERKTNPEFSSLQQQIMTHTNHWHALLDYFGIKNRRISPNEMWRVVFSDL